MGVRGLISLIRVLTTCASILAVVGCRPAPPGVVFWPGNAVKRAPSDFSVDEERQIEALRLSDPKTDAELAFWRGDIRLIGNRRTMPIFHGVPDDTLTRSLSGAHGRYGFKIIAFDESLLENEEFISRKKKYESCYNWTIYCLVTNSHSLTNVSLTPPAP